MFIMTQRATQYPWEAKSWVGSGGGGLWEQHAGSRVTGVPCWAPWQGRPVEESWGAGWGEAWSMLALHYGVGGKGECCFLSNFMIRTLALYQSTNYCVHATLALRFT